MFYVEIFIFIRFVIFWIFYFFNTAETPVAHIQIIWTTTFASVHIFIYLTKINHNLVQIRSIRDTRGVGYSDVNKVEVKDMVVLMIMERQVILKETHLEVCVVSNI